eukprot:m.1034967 g.1034967  ORF g.1034967 m.1034967 type:complete len:132 (-) comp24136_c1_seq14:1701-2096(-)
MRCLGTTCAQSSLDGAMSSHCTQVVQWCREASGSQTSGSTRGAILSAPYEARIRVQSMCPFKNKQQLAVQCLRKQIDRDGFLKNERCACNSLTSWAAQLCNIGPSSTDGTRNVDELLDAFVPTNLSNHAFV